MTARSPTTILLIFSAPLDTPHQPHRDVDKDSARVAGLWIVGLGLIVRHDSVYSRASERRNLSKAVEFPDLESDREPRRSERCRCTCMKQRNITPDLRTWLYANVACRQAMRGALNAGRVHSQAISGQGSNPRSARLQPVLPIVLLPSNAYYCKNMLRRRRMWVGTLAPHGAPWYSGPEYHLGL